MSKAKAQTYNLLTEYKVKGRDKNYMFKNPTNGGSHGKHHLSRKGETLSFCGNADLSDQPNRQTVKKVFIHPDVCVEGIQFLSGKGSICGKCLDMWRFRD